MVVLGGGGRFLMSEVPLYELHGMRTTGRKDACCLSFFEFDTSWCELLFSSFFLQEQDRQNAGLVDTPSG